MSMEHIKLNVWDRLMHVSASMINSDLELQQQFRDAQRRLCIAHDWDKDNRVCRVCGINLRQRMMEEWCVPTLSPYNEGSAMRNDKKMANAWNQCVAFNDKVAVGTEVLVKISTADGQVIERATKTSSEAWALMRGVAVVQVEGMSSSVLLEDLMASPPANRMSMLTPKE